jgi:hypothetical protein
MDNLADLEAEYQPSKYDAAEGDALLTEAGYTKDSEGFWADASGDRIQLVQFYNRTGNNQHYWTNWPATATDPYMNGIHPHTGYAYTLLQLEPTDAP